MLQHTFSSSNAVQDTELEPVEDVNVSSSKKKKKKKRKKKKKKITLLMIKKH